MGAGEITHWFSSALSDDEIGVLGAARGACESQQVLEALCALATRRAWSSHEQSERHPVGVRSDSVSALVLVLHLRTTGRACDIDAREVALDLAAGCHHPVEVQHVPGITNTICDALY